MTTDHVLPDWYSPIGSPRWLGLDVGGANLKIADGSGRAVSESFALWKRFDDLCEALRSLIERFDSERKAVGIAMTMTGELADCYATKAEGVRAIVEATVASAPSIPVRVATTDGEWLAPDPAIRCPQRVAAANWRLAARLVARCRPEGHGIWIDTGSTTTDVIPIDAGHVANRGSTDTERLLAGELVYSGVRRTPVCAIVDHLPYAGRECPVAAEWFATTADAWLLLGELAEDAMSNDTADGRPFRQAESIARLARCVCADSESFSHADAVQAAGRIADAQTKMVAAAWPPAIDWAVVGGEGDFLVERAVAKRRDQLKIDRVEELVGSEASRCFPAHAAAVLAASECEVAP
ncbi:MAG: hydantoinase/oxoprolinase family protein [Planctomycetota bacterium]